MEDTQESKGRYYPVRMSDGKLTVVKVVRNDDRETIEPVTIVLSSDNIKELIGNIGRAKDVFCEILYDVERNRNRELSNEEIIKIMYGPTE